MVEWIQSDKLQDYLTAVAFMEDRASRIRAGDAHEAIWLLEHPPLYTAGTSANETDLKDPARFRFIKAGAVASTPIMGPVKGWPT